MSPEFADFLLATPEAERTGSVFIFRGVIGSSGSGTRDRDCVGTIGRRIGKAVGVVVDNSIRDKVRYASAHDLRRSFVNRWVQRVTLQVLKEMMRHGDIDTTLRYYVGRKASGWQLAELTAEFGVPGLICSDNSVKTINPYTTDTYIIRGVAQPGQRV